MGQATAPVATSGLRAAPPRLPSCCSPPASCPQWPSCWGRWALCAPRPEPLPWSVDGCSQAGGPHGSRGPCPGSSRGLKASGTLADPCWQLWPLWDRRAWSCEEERRHSLGSAGGKVAMAVLASAPLFPSPRGCGGWRPSSQGARPPAAPQASMGRVSGPGTPGPCRRGTVAGWSEERRGRRLGSSGPASLALVSGWSCRGTVAAPATRFTWWTPPAAPLHTRPAWGSRVQPGTALSGVFADLPRVALCIPLPGVGRPSRGRLSRNSR